MYGSNSRGISYGAGFFMLIGFAIAGAFLAALIYTPVWTAMTGKSIKVLTEGMISPADSDAMKVVQSISAIVGFLLPAILVAAILHSRPMKLLGFTESPGFRQVGLVILIMVFSLIVSASLSYFNSQIPVGRALKEIFDKMELDYNRQVAAIIRLDNFGDYIVSLVVMAFLPALCEETLFRGGLQNFLARSTRNYWVAIIIVSLIFSAVHFSFYGFLSRFFLGMVLGLIFQWSGKLWLSILAHFVNNGLALTVLYVYKSQGKPINEAIRETNNAWYGILVLPIVIALFVYFRKLSGRPRLEEENIS